MATKVWIVQYTQAKTPPSGRRETTRIVVAADTREAALENARAEYGAFLTSMYPGNWAVIGDGKNAVML